MFFNDNDRCSLQLNHFRKEFHTEQEVVDLVKKCFPDIIPSCEQGSYFSFLFSLFAYIGHPLSLRELTDLFSVVFGKAGVNVKISRMEKAGYIKSVDFTVRDMGAKKAYYLTEKGRNRLLPFLPEKLALVDNKYRRTGGVVAMHDYAIGYSILQLILAGNPFTYNKEVFYGQNGYSRKERLGLSIDVMVQMQIGKQYSIFYIEQDMGTENVGVLCKKLEAYYTLGLYREQGALVFSIHMPLEQAGEHTFSQSAIKRLIDCMEDYGLNSIGELMMLPALPDEIKTTCNALINMENEYFRGADGSLFTVDKIKDYVNELSAGINVYKAAKYNQYQQAKTRQRFMSVCRRICQYIADEQTMRPELMLALKGYPIYFKPTSQLTHFLEDYTYAFRTSVEDELAYRFPFEFQDFKYTGMYPIEVGNIGNVYMPFTYQAADGRLIFICDIGSNVSAFCRMYCLCHNRSLLEQRILLIGVGPKEECLQFCSLADCISDTYDFDRLLTEKFAIVFFHPSVDGKKIETATTYYEETGRAAALTDLF